MLRLTNAINSSMTPPHSHMIPNAIFSAQNQNGDITIHVIAKIKNSPTAHDFPPETPIELFLIVSKFLVPNTIKHISQNSFIIDYI